MKSITFTYQVLAPNKATRWICIKLIYDCDEEISKTFENFWSTLDRDGNGFLAAYAGNWG
jgi:hypothetical protein